MHDLTQISTELRSLTSGVVRLTTIQDRFIEDKLSTIEEIQKASFYLDSKDEVLDTLTEAQKEAEAKSKSVFEKLLTTLIKEVMPDKNDKVVFNTGIKSNKTTLSIDTDVDGNIENIFRDKGGSIINVISMGLRFIVLSRTQNRRFLVFDEADCWLKPKYIPAFSSILNQLAQKIGVQVIYISHHDDQLFEGNARITKLYKGDSGLLESDTIKEPSQWSDESDDEFCKSELLEDIGITYIRLKNFKQHSDTKIDLSKKVTVITGDNDVGKSSVVDAIDCVINNAGRTSCIQHGQDSCEVEFGLEGGLVLAWNYKRKGQKKTRYTLSNSEDGSIIEECDNGKNTPSWLNDYLAMGDVDGHNLHLNLQKAPIFMMGTDISDTKRAQLLSLGREASYLKKMITLHGTKVSEYTKLSNSLVKKLASIKDQLAILRDVNEIKAKIGGIEDNLNHLQFEIDQASRLEKLFYRYDQSLEQRNNFVNNLNLLPSLPVEPVLNCNIEKIENFVSRYSRANEMFQVFSNVESINSPFEPALNMKVKNLEKVTSSLLQGSKMLEEFSGLNIIHSPELPILEKTDDVRSVGTRLSKAKNVIKLISQASEITPIFTPEIISINSLSETTKGLKGKKTRAQDLSVQIKEMRVFQGENERNIESLINETGGICPTCSNAFSENHNHLKKQG